MTDPLDHPGIHELNTVPVHRMVIADREAYWRRGRQWRNVQVARRKCAELTVRVNAPGDAAWVIESWARKWAVDGKAVNDAAVRARIMIAEYLEPLGKHVTIVLSDGRGPLAGGTTLVHGPTLVAGVLYRDPGVGNLPTGVALIDRTFEHGAAAGFLVFDLGGGHDYKSKWAPEEGTRSDVVVSSSTAWHALQAVRWARNTARTAVARATPGDSSGTE